MSKKYINTLDYYGYGENNKMDSAKSSLYKVKVSDKDGNIITIEKDDSLYACVGLELSSGVLSLVDKAHDDSVLAEINFPNAGEISNCRFDEDDNCILFDILTLSGEIQTVELDVASLVEIYEAGQGIEIGDKSKETGKKTISIKLVDGEELLTLSDDGLGLDSKVITEDELEAAISGKADTEYVYSLFETVSGFISSITEVEEAIESIFSELDNIRSGMTDIDEEIGDLNGRVDEIKNEVDGLKDDVDDVKEKITEISDDVNTLTENIDTLSGTVEAIEETIVGISGDILTLRNELNIEIESRKSTAFASVEYNSNDKLINFFNVKNEVIGTIDATDFIKDGMVDNVELVTSGDTTYLVITFNTDAGKEKISINIGDLFNSDNYYTKSEIDEKVTALENVDTQQWSVINQNRHDMEDVDGQLWAAISTEATNRENADTALQTEVDEIKAFAQTLNISINLERSERISADSVESERRESGDNALRAAIEAEILRARAAESSLSGDIETEKIARENADYYLRRDLNDKFNNLEGQITGFSEQLAIETNHRIYNDGLLEDEIEQLRRDFVTKAYVDAQDERMVEIAAETAVNRTKSYVDEQVDILEVELKHYCDSGHTELQKAISNNATKINVISNLRGVIGGDATNYDDSGNGILDVLHREFHEHIETIDGRFEFLENKIDDEILRATEEEENINNRIDNLVIDCGIY